MLRTYFDKNIINNDKDDDKCLFISDYIYNNYEKFISVDNIKLYIDSSHDLINIYKQIWPLFDEKRIISNIIALNLYILYI